MVEGSKRRVLITGAAGFTGRHLVELLSRDDSIELYLTGRQSGSSQPRFYQSDLGVLSSVRELIEKIRPSQIYHLVGGFTNQYDLDYNSNVLTTKNVLDAVRQLSLPCRVLLVGSAAEYGFPQDENKPIGEDHPLEPVSIYGLTKVYQYHLMKTYLRLYGLDIVYVRPFNFLGRGVSTVLFSGKMEQEIEKYKRGEIKKIVTGNLSVERDYIDIAEAVRYYQKVMKLGKTGEVYNVGSGEPITHAQVLRRLLETEGLSMDIVQESVHQIAGKRVVSKIYADITKLKNLK